MGTPARAYSSLRLSASAQKWGGVHRKMIRNRTSGSSPISPVAAAQPITGGSAPAAPPITIVVRRAPLQPGGVDHDVEEDREAEQPGRQGVGGHRENRDGTAGQHESQTKRFDRRDPAARNGPAGGPAHEGIDIRIA